MPKAARRGSALLRPLHGALKERRNGMISSQHSIHHDIYNTAYNIYIYNTMYIIHHDIYNIYII